jgi:hypothetical protein
VFITPLAVSTGRPSAKSMPRARMLRIVRCWKSPIADSVRTQ